MDWCCYYVAVWADKKHTVRYVIHVKVKKSFSAYRLFIFCSSQLHDGWWKACCDLLYFPDPFGKPTFRKNSACSVCIRVPDHSCPCTTLRWSPLSFNPQNISLVVKFVLILNPISTITAAFTVLHYQQISSCIFYSIIRIVSDNIERTRTAPCSHLSALKICETRFVLILQEFHLVCLWECTTRQEFHSSPRTPTSTDFVYFLVLLAYHENKFDCNFYLI